jgi:DNA-binding IclR family transcriptional regulator
MKKYNTNPRILHQLNPAQRVIYKLLLENLNKRKADQEPPTLASIKKQTFYALSTTADALQVLRKLGLIAYSSIKKCWLIITKLLKDHYDHHILSAWDKAEAQYDEIIRQHGLHGCTQSNFQYMRKLL